VVHPASRRGSCPSFAGCRPPSKGSRLIEQELGERRRAAPQVGRAARELRRDHAGTQGLHAGERGRCVPRCSSAWRPHRRTSPLHGRCDRVGSFSDHQTAVESHRRQGATTADRGRVRRRVRPTFCDRDDRGWIFAVALRMNSGAHPRQIHRTLDTDAPGLAAKIWNHRCHKLGKLRILPGVAARHAACEHPER